MSKFFKCMTVFLCVVMLLGMLPTAALAQENDDPVETFKVTFDPNFPGMEPVTVTVASGELVQPPEGFVREGYSLAWGTLFWGFWWRAFDFTTPITQDYTLSARWTRMRWDTVPSLAGEYADFFPVGTFGGGTVGNEQLDYHYATISGNWGKLTYNIGGGDKDSGAGTASRVAYDNAVAAINADDTLTAEEKAAKIEEANRHVELIANEPQLFSILRDIRKWNEAHPDQKKYYRQHVLAWHGGEQPDYFFCDGYHYDPENPNWASPETMLARLDNYIQKMMERYAPFNDVILSWDVVNEAIDDYTGQIRNSEGYQVGEWGTVFRRPDLDNDPDARLEAESAWVRQAFASARKWTEYYGCDWTLYYNDFQDSNKLYEPKMSQTIKMLKPIYEAGNIDGYGMQARLSYAYPTIDMLRKQMELGLTVADEISFSEADIRSDFEPNPNFDPSKPTLRVTADDPVWPVGSGYFERISSDNGNTFDVNNSPVRRIEAWGVGGLSSLAMDPEIMKKQADYAADLMDLVLEYKDQFGAVAWDGSSDSSTFNRTTGCQMWDTYGREKYSFFAVIGAPNRYKMREAIANGPAVEAAQGYTAESWAGYQDALEAAEALVDVRIYDLAGVNAVKDATANLEAATAALVPVDQLVIVTQPESYVGAIGSTADFAVEADGKDLTYQWYYSNNNGKNFVKSALRGSTTNTLSVVLSAYRDGQQYKCVVTDANGEMVETVVVTMRVAVPAQELVINKGPESFTGVVGETATFTVEATGEGLHYQWYYSNNGGKSFAKSTLPGATATSVEVVYKAFRAGQQYKCVVTDISGNTVESNIAILGAK